MNSTEDALVAGFLHRLAAYHDALGTARLPSPETLRQRALIASHFEERWHRQRVLMALEPATSAATVAVTLVLGIWMLPWLRELGPGLTGLVSSLFN
jgi:hypothetical protein